MFKYFAKCFIVTFFTLTATSETLQAQNTYSILSLDGAFFGDQNTFNAILNDITNGSSVSFKISGGNQIFSNLLFQSKKLYNSGERYKALRALMQLQEFAEVNSQTLGLTDEVGQIIGAIANERSALLSASSATEFYATQNGALKLIVLKKDGGKFRWDEERFAKLQNLTIEEQAGCQSRNSRFIILVKSYSADILALNQSNLYDVYVEDRRRPISATGGTWEPYVVVAGTLNVRDEPSTLGQELMKLSGGQLVYVRTDVSYGNWAPIRLTKNGLNQGFASKAYLRKDRGETFAENMASLATDAVNAVVKPSYSIDEYNEETEKLKNLPGCVGIFKSSPRISYPVIIVDRSTQVIAKIHSISSAFDKLSALELRLQ